MGMGNNMEGEKRPVDQGDEPSRPLTIKEIVWSLLNGWRSSREGDETLEKVQREIVRSKEEAKRL